VDAASGAHEATRADGAAVADVKQEVANHPTMVVEEDAVASSFVSLAALLLTMGVLLPVQAAKVGVEGVDLHDEDAEVVLSEEVAIVTDSVGGGWVVNTNAGLSQSFTCGTCHALAVHDTGKCRLHVHQDTEPSAVLPETGVVVILLTATK
jgi:hypothetical protein